ncbi:MAG: DNA methyltransferase [Gaiellaceae bacterium]
MTAQELLAAVAGVPGAKAVPVEGDGIVESRLVGGVEIARADQPGEQELRKLWRTRFGGGPTPLLLITDEPGQERVVRALGPIGHDGPIRLVGADELLRVLERLPSLGKLHAVRELAEELERLDRAGVSGLQVRGLGTQHLFTTRLREGPRWARLEELAQDLPSEWRALFERLGYDVEQLKGRNYVLRADGKATALVRPLADAAFAKLDAEGRPPEGVLIEDCLEQGVPYGFLASRGRLRLFEAKPSSGSAVARYLELDAESLTGDDRPLLGLLAPEYLSGDGFEALMRDARDFGAKLRERIDAAIRQSVLPTLGRELGEWAEREGVDLEDDEARLELEAAAMTFVFRALFLLYAESARHLPVDNEAYRPHSFTQIVRDAAAGVSGRSTILWDRIKVLVAALRDGEETWLVPAYNGALFAADGFEGAEILERASLRNEALAPALTALGIDPESDHGYDFSGLEIGHLGNIYEGLLSLRLSVADRPYSYDAGHDRYVAVEPDEAEVEEGELLWLTDEGGRKGGGVYYTPEPLVRHLVRRGVAPAFERHLAEVERLAESDPAAAAARLLEFRVLDPACGSAHFLVAVVDELADATARFLARRPLPALRKQLEDLKAGAGGTYAVGIEDVALLRRLLLKHCVHGVDLSPMGAEIAKISLWLASFVPGLSLAYLDHNIRVGNSLVGVADLAAVEDLAGDLLRETLNQSAALERQLLDVQDRTPDEVEASKRLEERIQAATAEARGQLDIWTGQPGFHWPLEFPQAFRDAGGFDAVVGNPPWEEVTVEELAFYARYKPGLRGLAADERAKELAGLRDDRPELAARLRQELEEAAAMRMYFAREPSYTSGAGDPDLYKFFCQRYRGILRAGGTLAVVLPRTAFLGKGSTDFREWLFGATSVERIDFLVNAGRWMFDTHAQYASVLVVTANEPPSATRPFEVAGVADSAEAFAAQVASAGILLRRAALGGNLEVPLLPSQADADTLGKIRQGGTPFAFGGGRWRSVPVRELDESLDKELWKNATSGWPLWKGASFDQYDPHGTEARLCPPTADVMKKAHKPNPGKGSLLAEQHSAEERAAAADREVGNARVAFRDVTNRLNFRTVIAVLVPPRTFLTNKAPYLTFVKGDAPDRACCLGVMNSLPFDWQARRFVERNLNFFILEGLLVPKLDDRAHERIVRAAARLSCPDDRFAEFAAATGVDVGPLTQEEWDELRAEIDALVARAYGLDEDDLETIFADFTLDAVPEPYRERVRAKFREIAPRMGEPGWFPDEDAIRRQEYGSTTPAERVMEGIALSRFATRVAVSGRKS